MLLSTMGPPNMAMQSGPPMMAGSNPYGPSGPPPVGLSAGSLGSQPSGVAPMYPSSTGGMHHSSAPPKLNNLNTTQLQQLSAQIKAYKLLSRNVPPPEALLSIVSGRRPTQAMLAAGKINRPPMSPQQQQQQRSMMGSVPSPGSISATDGSGGQPANINLYPPSPSARSQTESPKPLSQPSNPHSQLTQSHSNTGPVPNVTISSSGELPLPVRQALAAQSSSQTPSKDSNTTTEAVVKSEPGAKQKSQVKQVKVAPSGAPQGLDPGTMIKERENR